MCVWDVLLSRSFFYDRMSIVSVGRRMLVLALLGAFLFSNAFAAEVPGDKELNTGQDVTRPLNRLDVRYQYQLLAKKASKNTFTFRTDRPFFIDEKWGIGTRLDLPAVLTNKKTAQEPGGPYKFGLGDVLGQVLLIRTFNDRWAAAAGAQFIFPTSGTDQMGSGKYQGVPTAGVRRKLSEWSEGSFAGFLMRYAVDYAGSRKRNSISTLEMAPMLNWVLPRQWFMTAYPSTDIQINFQDRGAVFLPFDIAIGKTIPDKAVFSVEVAFPMYHSGELSQFNTSYEFKMEARIGIFY